MHNSLATCTVPNEWKLAKIIPAHKGGSKADVTNFRQISLTCTVSKLLEHIILKHITTYLENERILSPHQHGFRKELSTVTQLMELAHDISKSIDQQKQVDLIFLDFSKAFDKVSHKKLISKLELYLGAGPIITWIKNYLSNRSQFVEVNNETSAPTQVTSGVTQGCVLAPVLFLLFINDLPTNIKTNIRPFADDCNNL